MALSGGVRVICKDSSITPIYSGPFWNQLVDYARAEDIEGKLLGMIRDIHINSHRIYGSLQITKNLSADQKASRGRIDRLMRANGIRSKVVKNY
ncbi:transposase [Paenibacillus abyssi]|uniref:transposase n=1 Tax=Paenibacillus abyssi TaxID=1340531 RepID=UPI0035715B62